MTYQTDHPIIKEISIGDKFVLYNGQIITFVKYDDNNDVFYPFLMNNKSSYTKDLKYITALNKYHGWNIKERYITLKDKLNLI